MQYTSCFLAMRDVDFSAVACAIIAQTVTEVIGIKSESKAFLNDVTTHFLTSGFIGVLEWWINNSMPCNVQEVTSQLLFLLEPYTKHLVSR